MCVKGMIFIDIDAGPTQVAPGPVPKEAWQSFNTRNLQIEVIER